MKNYNKPWNDQKCRARERGIAFTLTYAEWLKIWVDSGHILARGRRRGQYCMARIGDTGPYAVGNVRIVTNAQNRSEMRLSEHTRGLMRAAKLGKRLSRQHRLNIAASNRGKRMSAEAIENMRRAKLGVRNPMWGRKASMATRKLLSKIRTGRKHTAETRKKMRRAALRAWAERRA